VLDVRSTLDSFCKTTVDGWRTECHQLQVTAKEVRRLLREALPAESAAVPVITIQQVSERDSPALLAATRLDVVDGSPPLIRPSVLPPNPPHVRDAHSQTVPLATVDSTSHITRPSPAPYDPFTFKEEAARTPTPHHSERCTTDQPRVPSPPLPAASPTRPVAVAVAATQASPRIDDVSAQTDALLYFAALAAKESVAMQTSPEFETGAVETQPGMLLRDDGTAERRLERALLMLGREQQQRNVTLRSAGVQVGAPTYPDPDAKPSAFPRTSLAAVPTAPLRLPADGTVDSRVHGPSSRRAGDVEDTDMASEPSAAAQVLETMKETVRRHHTADSVTALHQQRATTMNEKKASLALYHDALRSLVSDVEGDTSRVEELELALTASQRREEALMAMLDSYHCRTEEIASGNERVQLALGVENETLRAKCTMLATRLEELETQNVALAYRLGGVLTDREVFHALASGTSRGAALHRDASVSADRPVPTTSPVVSVQRFADAAAAAAATGRSSEALHSVGVSPQRAAASARLDFGTPASTGSAPVMPLPTLPQAPLPPPWRAAVDAKSGRTYYINPVSKQTSWTRPI
jgi:hypothetical protein